MSDQNGSDHHILAVNKDTCQFWEVYNNYFSPRLANGVNYTATSGYSYNGLSYGQPSGATDAAGLPLAPLTLHLDEIKAGAIHHALRFTLAGGYITEAPVPSTGRPRHRIMAIAAQTALPMAHVSG